MTPSLHLKLFGSPQISYQEQPLTGFVSAKVRALLIYLAVTGRPHSRDHLAELLWADTPASTRTNLRKALSNLRQLLGDRLVEDGKESIALDPQQVWVDVVEFGRLVKQGHEQEAAELYRADFLHGFNLSLSYEFEAWVLGEQSRLKSQMVEVLRSLATNHTSTSLSAGSTRNTLSQAILTVRRLLDLEPWHEENHRWLMELLAKDGQRSAALAHFEVCKRVLKEELDAPPAPETLALVADLQQPAMSAQPSLSRPTLANHAPKASDSDHVATPHSNTATNHRPPPRSHLPSSLTTLLGRAHEQQRIAELLRQAPGRLVTLIGPPGIGKTRLGLAVAEELQATLTDGVYFVPLAAIQEAELVVSALVVALRLTADNQQTPLETVKEFLRPKASLLLLDNFEQLLTAAPLLSELLTACPALRLLVTSRERLHLYGEQLYRVPPLTPSAAVALFVQRAQALDVDFALTPATEPLLQEICQQVDCLPLAIELSAARIELLSLPTLLTQLREQRLALLTDGPRDMPDRQRTLHNAIQSSYRLLTEPEQVLFRTLGICVGGFDLWAVNALRFAPATLQALVNKSLVQVSAITDNQRRFLLLETLREFALEQLDLAGEKQPVAQRHVEVYLGLAEEAATHLRQADQAEWLERLAQDHDNLRAALRWACEHQPEAGARLAIALWRFWYTRGYNVEGWQWLQNLSALVEQPTLRANLLYGQGMLARRLLRHTDAIACFTQSLTLFRQLRNERKVASVLRGIGMIYFLQDQHLQARPFFLEALPLFRQFGDLEGIASTLESLAYVAESEEEAQRMHAESLALRRQTGNLRGISISLSSLIQGTIYQDEWAVAHRYQQEQQQISEQLGDQNGMANSLRMAGLIAYGQGNYEAAQAAFEKSCELCQSTNDHSITSNFEWLGRVALKLGDIDRGQRAMEQALRQVHAKNALYDLVRTIGCFILLAMARRQIWRTLCLASAFAALCETFEMQYPRLDREEFDHAEAEARRLLPADEAAMAQATGRALTKEQTITYALTNILPAISPGGPRP
ncbi:MAG: AfsR/SARP family transcriptional regulator [Caldilineaceae bacterium]